MFRSDAGWKLQVGLGQPDRVRPLLQTAKVDADGQVGHHGIHHRIHHPCNAAQLDLHAGGRLIGYEEARWQVRKLGGHHYIFDNHAAADK